MTKQWGILVSTPGTRFWTAQKKNHGGARSTYTDSSDRKNSIIKKKGAVLKKIGVKLLMIHTCGAFLSRCWKDKKKNSGMGTPWGSLHIFCEKGQSSLRILPNHLKIWRNRVASTSSHHRHRMVEICWNPMETMGCLQQRFHAFSTMTRFPPSTVAMEIHGLSLNMMYKWWIGSETKSTHGLSFPPDLAQRWVIFPFFESSISISKRSTHCQVSRKDDHKPPEKPSGKSDLENLKDSQMKKLPFARPNWSAPGFSSHSQPQGTFSSQTPGHEPRRVV